MGRATNWRRNRGNKKKTKGIGEKTLIRSTLLIGHSSVRKKCLNNLIPCSFVLDKLHINLFETNETNSKLDNDDECIVVVVVVVIEAAIQLH